MARMGIPALFGRKSGGTQNENSLDVLRERRLDDVKTLAERFTYDLGLLIAGHRVNLEEYVHPAAAARLRASIDPFLATGDAMRPNFGEYGELRVEGNLAEDQEPIQAQLDFDDQSVRETANGDLIQVGRRRMRLSLEIDPSGTRVLDFTLAPAGAS